jgi:HSP90 family molecular chaperone
MYNTICPGNEVKEMKAAAQNPPKEVKHILLKVPSDLYKTFRANCLEEDTNMRAKLLQLIENYTQVRSSKKLSIDEYFGLSKEEQEEILGRASKAAITNAHALGLATTHGDEKGIYKLYPDGRREYVKLYSSDDLDD